MSNKGIQGRDNVTIKIYIYSMNKNVLIIVVVVVIIVLGIGWYFMQTPAVVQQENETETPSEVIVNLSEQSCSGLNGTAILTQTEAGLKVVLSLAGAPTDVPQPAHVHLNNCANIGGVKYPLDSLVNGYSQTIITTTLGEILNSLPLSINVHKSASEASMYVACGDITKP